MISAIYLGNHPHEGEVVVPELIEMLQDEDAEVRTAAAAALGLVRRGGGDRRARAAKGQRLTRTRTSRGRPAYPSSN